jgi:hypothetical protein
MGPAPTWSLCAVPRPPLRTLVTSRTGSFLRRPDVSATRAPSLAAWLFDVGVLKFRSFTSGVFAVWFAGSSSMMFLPYGRPPGLDALHGHGRCIRGSDASGG